jgi:hypothetical protein
MEETFAHLFFDCTYTVQIHKWFLRTYCNLPDPDPELRKNFFFLGQLTGNNRANSANNAFGLVCSTTIQFLIWEATKPPELTKNLCGQCRAGKPT